MCIRSFFARSFSGATPFLALALLTGGCAAETSDHVEASLDDAAHIGDDAPGASQEEGEDTGEAASAIGGDVWSDDYCYGRGWRVGRHYRDLADVDGDGRLDIVGFNDVGVQVSRSMQDRFASPDLWSDHFGYNQGWRVGKHLRYLADIDGDHRLDIVGFQDDGVWVAKSLGDRFGVAERWLAALGYRQGWREDRHIRRVIDMNHDGLADVVAIGNEGVYLSLSTGIGFSLPVLDARNFGYAQGWRVNKHVRDFADFDGDGYIDVAGIQDDGVYVSRFDGVHFQAPTRWTAHYGRQLGNWRMDRHMRMFADVDGDGRADIVGLHDAGAYVAISTGHSFGIPSMWTPNFGYVAGHWRMDRHIRRLVDLNGDNRLDLVGFGDDGIYRSLSRGTHFEEPVRAYDGFGFRQGWDPRRHLRFLGDVSGRHEIAAVGFNDVGVIVHSVAVHDD